MFILNICEFLGTVAFAVSGALVGIDKELDYFGVIVLAVTTAVGGGIVRDVLIGCTPPLAVQKPSYTIISILTALVVLRLYKRLDRFKNTIQFFDAVGLAAFTAIGASMAFLNNLSSPFIVIILGLLTGTGGGIIRDVFAQEIPFVFRKEIYAIASILGVTAYLVFRQYLSPTVAVYACFIITLVVRLVAIKYGLNLKVVKKSTHSY